MAIHSEPPPRCGEQVDPNQFRDFLRTLDPNADWFTIQTFTDAEPKPAPDPLAQVTDVKRIDRAVFASYERGAGVWVTVNDTQGKGRKKPAVVRVRGVWQEDDEGFEGEFPLEPSLVVETSPGHYHRYWLVDGDWPADEQGRIDFDGVMDRMVASYGSDPGAKGINRVLRLPGFLHRKNPAEPHMVRAVGGNRQRYTREEILAAFPPIESHSSAKGNGYAGTGESYSELVRQVVSGDHYHPALLALAWRQVGAGIPAGMVVEFLRGLMLSMPEDRRDARWHSRFAEIPRLVSSAAGKKPDDAEAWPGPVPLPAGRLPVAKFDYDMLPERVVGRVKDITERMQCPAEFVAVPMMVGLGSVIGRKVGIRPKERDDWTMPANQFGAVVAPPGKLKTPAHNEALAPLRALEVQAREDFRAAKAAYKAAVKAAVAAGHDADSIDEPVQRRYITGNITAEAMGEILKQTPNGVLNLRDELMALLRFLDDPAQGTARELYLQGWSGVTGYNFDRIGRGFDNYVPAVCISMFGTTQPSMISRYIAEIRMGGRGNDGLMQRFGLVVWPDTPPNWIYVDRHPNALQRQMTAAVFKKLNDITAEAVGATQEKIDNCPVGIPYLRFAQDAQAAFVKWYSALECRLAAEDWPDDLLREHVSKYRGLVPALALICHLTDWDPKAGCAGPVSLEALQKALAWVTYLETHARRIYASGDVSVVEAAQAIIAKVRSGHLMKTGFSSRDVWRPQWSRLTHRPTVSTALELLVDYDWAKAAMVETNGRKATVYSINPKVLL